MSAEKRPAPDVRELRLRNVRTDGGTQTRDGIDAEVLEEYAQAMADGEEFPPGVVFYDDTAYWLADGFHRHAAAIAAGLTTFHFEVRQGAKRDALLFSVGANAQHGLRRTPADKRRAVETLLRDREWSRWGDRELARLAGVSKTFVGKVRAYAQPETVGTPRLAERGGTVYEMRPGTPAQRVNTQREAESAAAGRNYTQDWLRHLLSFTPEQFVRMQQILDGSVDRKIVAEAVASVMIEASTE
jgi:hypothetical protein